jgi:hypothetical protein
MKREIFFKKFDQFADAPDAVAKMRELVLELAVQGRLTSSLPSDGTVPSVIEFRERAAALANSLGLRSPKELIEEVEPPFAVPPTGAGWHSPTSVRLKLEQPQAKPTTMHLMATFPSSSLRTSYPTASTIQTRV